MSAGEAWGCGVTAFVSVGISALWLRTYGVPKRPFGAAPPSTKYLELERDRVLGAAKGIASTAIGFLTVLVTAYLDRKNLAEIPEFFLVCYVLGSLGCVAIAAWMNGRTRGFVADIKDGP
jgi:peptidoglycan/LPS O-acetylase OafA/YrhL